MKCRIYFDGDLYKNARFSVPKYFDNSVAEAHGYWILEKVENFDPVKPGTFLCTFLQIIPFNPIEGETQTTGSGDFRKRGTVSGISSGLSVGRSNNYSKNQVVNGSIAIGKGLVATTPGQIVSGQFNEDIPGAREVIGNGTQNSRNNLFVRLSNGRGVYNPTSLKASDPDTGETVEIKNTDNLVYVQREDVPTNKDF